MVAEFEQESDSPIFKLSGPGSGFKNFGTGAEPEKMTPATSGRLREEISVLLASIRLRLTYPRQKNFICR